MMKKHFSKDLVTVKNNNEDFENSTKCWICHNAYCYGNVKERDHCYITGKCRGSPHKDSNITVELNHKIRNIFYNLKSYDSYFVMQDVKF